MKTNKTFIQNTYVANYNMEHFSKRQKKSKNQLILIMDLSTN